MVSAEHGEKEPEFQKMYAFFFWGTEIFQRAFLNQIDNILLNIQRKFTIMLFKQYMLLKKW